MDEYSVAEITVSTIEPGLLLEMAGVCTRLSSHFLSVCPEQARLDKLFLFALWFKNRPGSL